MYKISDYNIIVDSNVIVLYSTSSGGADKEVVLIITQWSLKHITKTILLTVDTTDIWRTVTCPGKFLKL